MGFGGLGFGWVLSAAFVVRFEVKGGLCVIMGIKAGEGNYTLLIMDGRFGI